MDKVTVPGLADMKRAGRKIVGVVAWDYQIATIADRAGVDLLVVGDSVGVNLWGHATPFEVTMEEMIILCRAVRRGAQRALVCCDFPFGPLQEGVDSAVRAAVRLVKEAGADLVKLDGAVDYPEAVAAIERAGIPVFAQFGLTPQLALRHGIDYSSLAAGPVQGQSAAGSVQGQRATSSVQGQGATGSVQEQTTNQLVVWAKGLEEAGASMLDFTNSGPVAGEAVAKAVSIPVLGGFGGGPWLDGRVRMAHAAIGYAASGIDNPPDTYANVAATTFSALDEYADDVRAERQIKGGVPWPRP